MNLKTLCKVEEVNTKGYTIYLSINTNSVDKTTVIRESGLMGDNRLQKSTRKPRIMKQF